MKPRKVQHGNTPHNRSAVNGINEHVPITTNDDVRNPRAATAAMKIING
jgi:hypothetical protein